MQNTSLINAFPQEVLVRTLHYCDYVTIIRFSLTCKKSQRVVISSVSLQLHIELEINGLEIAGGSSGGNPSYSLALKELKDYQDAWYNFRLGPMVQQPTGSSNAGEEWHLRNGAYHGEFRASGTDYEDVLVDSTQMLVLGSSTVPPAIKFQKLFSFCVADPRQDLAVLVESKQEGHTRFHIHSLTTGKPHPLAEHPVLTVTMGDTYIQDNNPLNELVSADPEIMGDYFITRMHWFTSVCDASEILLWDWKTGVLLARIYSGNITNRWTFIDKEHLLVSSALRKDNHQSVRIALFIYRVPNSTMAYEVPPNADFHPSLYPNHSPILVFELPELHPLWKVTEGLFRLCSDPLPGDIVHSKSVNFLCSRVTTLYLDFRICFNPDGQACLFGSSLGPQTDLRVFVHMHSIFDHISRHLSEGTVTVPWSEWGTAATRWFIRDSAELPTSKIYRSQYLWPIEIQSILLYASSQLSIVDFNAPIIKRHAYASALASQTKHGYTTEAEQAAVLEGRGLIAGGPFQTEISSATLPLPRVGQVQNHQVFAETVGSDMKTIIRNGFKTPVVSCLPYRAVTKVQRMPGHYHWQIHGEYLIGLPWEGKNRPFSLYKLELPARC